MLDHDEEPLAAYPPDEVPPADGADAAAPAAAAASAAPAAGVVAVAAPEHLPFPLRVHPERSDRLRAIAGLLVARGLWARMLRVREREASPREVAWAADAQQAAAVAAQVEAASPALREGKALAGAAAAAAAEADDEAALADALAALSAVSSPHVPDGEEGERIGDLFFSPATGVAARTALASVLDVTRAVLAGRAQRGLALVRPPGHHASCMRSAGFCVFNNVAAAAKMALAEGAAGRVVIVDWDVHHGDGTERVFFADPRVLYVSIHRYDEGRFYPASGHAARAGSGAGAGYSMNIALNGRWFGDTDYKFIFEMVVMPVLRSFAPQLVLVSCGFDAARGDPLGNFDLTPQGYSHMTAELCSLGAPLVVALEGGYNLAAISVGAEAVARVLLGEAPLPLAVGAGANSARDRDIARRREACGGCNAGHCDACEVADAVGGGRVRAATFRAVREIARVHAAHWPVLRAQATDGASPLEGCGSEGGGDALV